jgi:hypothetical protein
MPDPQIRPPSFIPPAVAVVMAADAGYGNDPYRLQALADRLESNYRQTLNVVKAIGLEIAGFAPPNPTDYAPEDRNKISDILVRAGLNPDAYFSSSQPQSNAINTNQPKKAIDDFLTANTVILIVAVLLIFLGFHQTSKRSN